MFYLAMLSGLIPKMRPGFDERKQFIRSRLSIVSSQRIVGSAWDGVQPCGRLEHCTMSKEMRVHMAIMRCTPQRANSQDYVA